MEGYRCIKGFLNPRLCENLVFKIDEYPWIPSGGATSRRVQHYGYRYDYKKRSVDVSDYLGEMPRFLDLICEAVLQEGVFDTKPDQVILNEYLPGQGISPHIDCQPCFQDTIGTITLGSGCLMNFRNVYTNELQERYLEVGDLHILKGESRYSWTHGIRQVKEDRYSGIVLPRGRRVSITLRNIVPIQK
jgi:alkylated DNA repair dioxygenase AlkB